MTGEEVVGQHHQLNGCEFEQTLRDSEAWRAAVHGASKSLSNGTIAEQYPRDHWDVIF